MFPTVVLSPLLPFHTSSCPFCRAVPWESPQFRDHRSSLRGQSTRLALNSSLFLAWVFWMVYLGLRRYILSGKVTVLDDVK